MTWPDDNAGPCADIMQRDTAAPTTFSTFYPCPRPPRALSWGQQARDDPKNALFPLLGAQDSLGPS